MKILTTMLTKEILTTNHTNHTNKTKQDFIILLFVRFVWFVVNLRIKKFSGGNYYGHFTGIKRGAKFTAC
jgi:hypothetical protein